MTKQRRRYGDGGVPLRRGGEIRRACLRPPLLVTPGAVLLAEYARAANGIAGAIEVSLREEVGNQVVHVAGTQDGKPVSGAFLHHRSVVPHGRDIPRQYVRRRPLQKVDFFIRRAVAE